MRRAYHVEMQHATSKGEKRTFVVVAGSPTIACRKAIRAARKQLRGPWDIRAMAELPQLVM